LTDTKIQLAYLTCLKLKIMLMTLSGLVQCSDTGFNLLNVSRLALNESLVGFVSTIRSNYLLDIKQVNYLMRFVF